LDVEIERNISLDFAQELEELAPAMARALLGRHNGVRVYLGSSPRSAFLEPLNY